MVNGQYIYDFYHTTRFGPERVSVADLWTAGCTLGLGLWGTSQSPKVVSLESDLETNAVMACKGHRRCLRSFRR